MTRCNSDLSGRQERRFFVGRSDAELVRMWFPHGHSKRDRRARKTDMRRSAFLAVFGNCRSGYLQNSGRMPFAEVDMLQPRAEFFRRHGRKPGFSGGLFGMLTFRIVKSENVHPFPTAKKFAISMPR